MLRILRIRRILLFAVLLITVAQAQPLPAPATKHCLWKVQSPSNTVYLLGSIHLLKAENYPLPETMERAFAEAHTLVLEIIPDSLMLPSVQQYILAKGILAEGKTLQGSLSSETYALAQKRARELGLNLMLLQNFEPWLVGLTMTAAKLQTLGLNPQHGLDRHFFEKAKAAKKPVLHLESVAFQISRFDEMSTQDQEAFLSEALKEWDLIETEFNELLRMWSSGEADSLAQKLYEGFKPYPKVYEALLTARNRNWLPHLEKYLSEKEKYLVVVGAGHMVGETGLIELLRGKGYRVEQL